ncbi:LPP20 family lipoprotein [bacterium]|nr:LPP20 family lipoprotein [bacterium]
MKKLLLFYFWCGLLAISLLALPLEARAADAAIPEEITGAREAFIKGVLTVKGEGSAPEGSFSHAQKRLLALRAAKIAAYREITERLDGVAVSGETTVFNASASSDEVRTSVQGIITGAEVVKEVYDPETGIGEVYLTLRVPDAFGAILPVISGTMPQLPEYRGIAIAQSGPDGLIIDARGIGFKPALLNRIVTAGGEVVYDPSRLSREVAARGGAPGYTSDLEKARELLLQKGSTNPLVVKAGRVSKSPTDIELDPTEASVVFASNQSGRFLEAARIIFVLD